MKILHIHPSLAGGGIEAMISGLANEMVKTEDVTVCSIFEPKSSDVFYRKLAPEVKTTTCHKRKMGFSVKEIWRIYQLIRRGKYDVVHIHGFIYYYLVTIFLLFGKKPHFFYTIHSDAWNENRSWDTKLVRVKRWLFKHDIVTPITISTACQTSFVNLYKTSSELVYNGIPKPDTNGQSDDTAVYRFTPDTKLFIHPGRISEPKNQRVLCQVFQRLIEEGEDVVLLIAGAPQEPDIYEGIKPYFSDRIVYLGERSDVPQLMSQCCAMCLPSVWEGLPVVILEALAVGCIPICSPVGGIVDVVTDGVNGMLSKSPDAEDYYHTMKEFLCLPIEKRTTLKEKALESFANYQIEHTSLQYLELYRNKVTKQ